MFLFVRIIIYFFKSIGFAIVNKCKIIYLQSIFPKATISNNIVIKGNINNILIKKGALIADNVILSTEKYGGTIEIGENTSIREGSIINAYGGNVTFGNNCSLNQYCLCYGHGGLQIGNFVRIATQSSFIAAEHKFEEKNTFIHNQGITCKGIQIEDDVWIGAGVIVQDGIHIEKGVVIGSGAVVNRNLEKYSINVGIPVRTIKYRN
jgi:acetyltransferase-like isoleucine patch superfamily enzyme